MLSRRRRLRRLLPDGRGPDLRTIDVLLWTFVDASWSSLRRRFDVVGSLPTGMAPVLFVAVVGAVMNELGDGGGTVFSSHARRAAIARVVVGRWHLPLLLLLLLSSHGRGLLRQGFGQFSLVLTVLGGRTRLRLRLKVVTFAFVLVVFFVAMTVATTRTREGVMLLLLLLLLTTTIHSLAVDMVIQHHFLFFLVVLIERVVRFGFLLFLIVLLLLLVLPLKRLKARMDHVLVLIFVVTRRRRFIAVFLGQQQDAVVGAEAPVIVETLCIEK